MTIEVQADHYSDDELEGAVDEDIANFDKFFQSLGNDPLSLFEKAAIKTYLWYKTHGESSTKDMNKLRQVLDGVGAEQAPVHGATNGESDGT
jgi:hypothetical protein